MEDNNHQDFPQLISTASHLSRTFNANIDLIQYPHDVMRPSEFTVTGIQFLNLNLLPIPKGSRMLSSNKSNNEINIYQNKYTQDTHPSQ